MPFWSLRTYTWTVMLQIQHGQNPGEQNWVNREDITNDPEIITQTVMFCGHIYTWEEALGKKLFGGSQHDNLVFPEYYVC